MKISLQLVRVYRFLEKLLIFNIPVCSDLEDIFLTTIFHLG